jgi:hypothetical protein
MGVADTSTFQAGRTLRKCRLLHGLAKTCATFDDPDLVSWAALVPVMALARRAGLGDLAGEHVAIGGVCG